MIFLSGYSVLFAITLLLTTYNFRVIVNLELRRLLDKVESANLTEIKIGEYISIVVLAVEPSLNFHIFIKIDL